MPQKKFKLNESLEHGDLKELVSNTFTVDRFSSKMGEDRDIVVIGFNVKEKYPAVDLMEFIEKGYNFILDADISAGEEPNGEYQVFVEIERTNELPGQLKNLLNGVSQLCDCSNWNFKYQKLSNLLELTDQNITKYIPMTAEEYDQKILEMKTTDIKEFFDQGATDISLAADNILTFSKPYSGDIKTKFVSIGDYNDVKDTLAGPIDLSESSQSQVLFLNKFLGNYDINKIGNKFLIRNGSKAIVIEKDRW